MNYGFIEPGVGLKGVPSRCMTLDLSWLAEGRPALAGLPFMPGLKLHCDIEPIAEDDDGYIWWTIDVEGLDLMARTLHGKSVTDKTLRSELEREPQWQVYRRRALQVAQGTVERAVMALDAAEADEALRAIAQSVREEVLDTADRVRDAERSLLMWNWHAIERLLVEITTTNPT